MSIPRIYTRKIAIAGIFACSIIPTYSFAADESDLFTLEEIVVTAQRRTESIQDVSIAMKAITGDQIAKLGLRNLDDLIEHVPGVELYDERGAGMPIWVIRSVALADFNANNSPAAAIYYDEFYLSSNILNGVGLYDIDRIEVLKGPQGGLYGRNTTGGAVRILSKRPSFDETNGYVKANYGRYDRYGIEGAVGGTISENLAVRLSGMIDQGGGWQDSLVTPEDDQYGDRDFWALRGQVALRFNEGIELNIKIDGGRDRSETPLASAIGTQDPNTLVDTCAPVLAGSLSDSCLTWTNAVGIFTSQTPSILASDLSGDGKVVASDLINELDNDWFGINAQLEIDIDFATFKYISAYMKYNYNQNIDIDAMPLSFAHELSSLEIEAWSQEARLVSNNDGPYTWLIGAIYSEDTDKETRTFDLSDDFVFFLNNGTGIGDRGFFQKTKMWSLYAQGTYDIQDDLTVETSVRYTDEEKTLNDAFLTFTDIGFALYEDYNDTSDFNLGAHWSGSIGLNWKPTDDVMAYAKVTRSYKSGGFNGGFSFSIEELEPYKEETIWAYEIGVKSELLDNTLRLNAAAFYYDYQDAQGFVAVPTLDGGALGKLATVGNARHLGLEGDIIWLPEGVEGLSLTASGTYVDAIFTTTDPFTEMVTGLIRKGLRRPGPKWSYTLQGRYEKPIANALLGAIQINYSWRSDIIPDDSFPTLPNGSLEDHALFNRPGYGLLNASISLLAEDNTWSITLMGKNLTDEAVVLNNAESGFGSYSTLYGRPRSWTLEAQFSF